MSRQSPAEIWRRHLKGLKQVNFSYNLLNRNSQTCALRLVMLHLSIIYRVDISVSDFLHHL